MKKSTISALNRGDSSQITTYQAGVIQSSVHRTLQKYSDAALKPFGISKMQWMIIGTILDGGEKGVRITELAKTLDTTLPYITNAINLLESRNIVARTVSTTDSRAKLVTIDPDFRTTCEEIEQTLRNALRKSIYAHVDPDDFRVYLKVLFQMHGIKE